MDHTSPLSDAGVVPSVMTAERGGISGMRAVTRTSDRQMGRPRLVHVGSDNNEKDPAPPIRVGGLVDEVYHKVGNANDMTFIKRTDGHLVVFDFHVYFSRKVRAGGGKPGAPSTLSTEKRAVQTYINGKLQPQLYMRVGEDGFCAFPDGTQRPRAEALKSGLGLVPGVNQVRFEVRFLRDARVLVAECFAFLWSMEVPVIVMDIDGTITRSDVPGLLMTLSPGIYDHTHSGVCELLARIANEGAQVMYLTSRPISLASKTRAFLASLKQGEASLPLGALHCSLDKVERVIWREVFSKNMHEYKISVLQTLVMLFREAGKPFAESVFAAGIGNKTTDAMAYRAAGVPREYIFLIDSSSNLQLWDGDTSKLGGNGSDEVITPLQEPSRRSRRKRLGISKRLFGSKSTDITVALSRTISNKGIKQGIEREISQSSNRAWLPDFSIRSDSGSERGLDSSWSSASSVLERKRSGSLPQPIVPKTRASSSRHLSDRSRSHPREQSPLQLHRQGSTAPSTPASLLACTVDTNGQRAAKGAEDAATTTAEETSSGYSTYADKRLLTVLRASLVVARGHSTGAKAAEIDAVEQLIEQKLAQAVAKAGGVTSTRKFSPAPSMSSEDHGAGGIRKDLGDVEKGLGRKVQSWAERPTSMEGKPPPHKRGNASVGTLGMDVPPRERGGGSKTTSE